MNFDQVMDWIDNAAAEELRNPPKEVIQYLERDRECLNYYMVSLKLSQSAEEVDLWTRFRLSLHAKVKRRGVGVHSWKLLWGLSGAAAVGIFLLLLMFHPFSFQERMGSELIGTNDYGALESVFQVASFFDENSESEQSALDYYYQLSGY